MADPLRQRRRRPPPVGASEASAAREDAGPKPRRPLRAAVRPRTAAVVLGALVFFAVALAVVFHWHTWLPEPRGADAPADVFAEGRARDVLGNIMRLGYRPVGSRANEELVPAYLLSEVRCPCCSLPC